MLDEPEDDVLVLGDEPEQDDLPDDVNDRVEDQQDDDPDVEIPMFGDAGEEEPTDSDLVKHLRSELRKSQARAKAVEEGPKVEPAIVVGDKPTLESCDYDEDRFDAAYDEWKDRKRKAEEQADQRNATQRQADQQWEAEKATYAKQRAALPYRDVADVEAVVASTLRPDQLALIVKTANDGPKLIYALGKNPGKLQALAGVTDPIKFIAAAVRLEAEVKMSKRRPTAEPDTPVRGSASLAAGTVDKREEKLVADARRTNDRSALIKYRADKRAKA